MTPMPLRTPLAFALALVLASAAFAQDKPTGPKLYRWVDKQGKVVYQHFGEGAYAATEAKIRTLLAEPAVASR